MKILIFRDFNDFYGFKKYLSKQLTLGSSENILLTISLVLILSFFFWTEEVNAGGSVLTGKHEFFSSLKKTEFLDSSNDRGEVKESFSQGLKVIFPVTLFSTELANKLAEIFEEEYKIPIKIIALCTGDALEFAKRENEGIDVLIGHDRDAKEKFIKEGYAVNLRSFLSSDYVLVGPPEDPAGVKGIKKITKALKIIAKKEASFFSRADNSGTHTLEKKMWDRAKIKPKGHWYIETKLGNVATLDVVSRKKGYFITHRASYLQQLETLDLEVMVEDKDLITPYEVMVMNPERFPETNYIKAMMFVGFLTSPKIQKYISEFGQEEFGRQIYQPLAVTN